MWGRWPLRHSNSRPVANAQDWWGPNGDRTSTGVEEPVEKRSKRGSHGPQRRGARGAGMEAATLLATVTRIASRGWPFHLGRRMNQKAGF